jgi:hypothetical protein
VVGACIGVGIDGASALAQADEATPKTAAAPAQIQPQDRRKIGDGDGRRGSRDCRADRHASARWHSEGRRGRPGNGSHGPSTERCAIEGD